VPTSPSSCARRDLPTQTSSRTARTAPRGDRGCAHHRTRGEFNGVLAGMFRVGATSVSALYGDIAKLRVGVSGDVFVVDGGGRVIQHPDAALVGVNLMSQKVSKTWCPARPRFAYSRSQREDVVAAMPHPGTTWALSR